MKTQMTTYTITPFEDPEGSGNLVIQFPDEVLEKTGWKEGTVLSWTVTNGVIYLNVANTQQSVDFDD